MTSKMPNPHYLPEVAIKTTIINFTVTMEGLEDQLCARGVRLTSTPSTRLVGRFFVEFEAIWTASTPSPRRGRNS